MTIIKEYDYLPEDYDIKTHGEIIRIINNCVVCKKTNAIRVVDAHYYNWRNGAFAQDAFPYLTSDQRELVISGTHPACFEKIFEELED